VLSSRVNTRLTAEVGILKQPEALGGLKMFQTEQRRYPIYGKLVADVSQTRNS
jgi:hypothetical protein